MSFLSASSCDDAAILWPMLKETRRSYEYTRSGAGALRMRLMLHLR